MGEAVTPCWRKRKAYQNDGEVFRSETFKIVCNVSKDSKQSVRDADRRLRPPMNHGK